MTDQNTGDQDVVLRVFEPFEVHFFSAMTIPASDMNGLMVRYGQTITVTPSIHFFSQDRNGNSWLDLIDDPAAQVSRYGKVRFARGPWPADLSPLEPGTAEESFAIADAWQEMWNLPTEEERSTRRAELRKIYGAPPALNRVIAKTPGTDGL